MTEARSFRKLLPLVQEVTGVPEERIRMESVLVEDLGAESLDLLDLSFLIEETFGVTIGADEFERQARAGMPGGVYERDGLLTEEAIARLREALPEVPPREAPAGAAQGGPAAGAQRGRVRASHPAEVGGRRRRPHDAARQRSAMVTGGSGAVGAAIVRVLAREGCRVAFSYHRGRRPGRGAAGGAGPAAGADVRAWPLDVLDAAAAARLAQTVEQEFGPVDILVNNAGFAQVLPFAMIEEADWDRMLDVNVKGMFLVTKAFARGMIRRKRGSIVNIGSLAGVRMLEVPVHYATAKSAVVGFTLSLARELGRYAVRVNAVVPGMLSEGVSVNVPGKQQEEYKQLLRPVAARAAGGSGRAGGLPGQRPRRLHQRPGDPGRRGNRDEVPHGRPHPGLGAAAA